MSFHELNDLESTESRNINFDIKGLLFKLLNSWYLIVISVGIALFIANYLNVRKQNVYSLDTLISIENDQNPFFSANTSISFNWGGVSGKTGRIITALKTRTHNEIVVDSLQYYVQYLQEGKYRKDEIYKNAPFYLELDKENAQVLNLPIGIRFVSQTEFELFVNFESNSRLAQIYQDKSKTAVQTPLGLFNQKFSVNQPVKLPFFNATLRLRENKNVSVGSEYYIRFLNFDSVVSSYRNGVRIEPYSRTASSILRLSLTGNNKAKIVDFLNATVAIFSQTELERKNIYATNTIEFIEDRIAIVDDSLKDVSDELNSFRRQNKVFNIDQEMLSVSEELRELQKEKTAEDIKYKYLENLEDYLNTKTDYTKIAAPTSVGIEEINILNSVAKINALAVQRQELESTTREGSILFKGLDGQIDAEKNVLLETIKATKSTISTKLNSLDRNLTDLQGKLSALPEDQQEYLKIQRRLDISLEAYNVYLAKHSEASIIKAANISDVTVVDEAKDIGGGLVGPNKRLNYVMALMVGFLIPTLMVFVVFLLDTSIRDVNEVERLSKIPILGLIGKEPSNNNLVVYEKPKSSLSEAFRTIRSSLQFFYKKQHIKDGKTLMITSSVSGEGKTFCSINIATVYALTGKKTILLGMDLRKPKIFGDFNITNDKGIVNCLIGEQSIDEVTHKTSIENLDVIPSGPIPPNPSELLMSDHMKDIIDDLRLKYDMIILDTPPLGLVSDALELTQYADASIFVVRLGYTKRGMLQLINAKYKAGEIKNVSYVLNFYKHKNSNYGYSYGYGYGYGTYGNAYHENESKSILKKLINKVKKRKI